MKIINYELIKKLRLITGISYIKCKNSFIKNKLNFNNALNYLLNDNDNIHYSYILKEGIILHKFNDKLGVIIEINCQTDFVSKNNVFINFSNKVLEYAFLNINKLSFIQQIFKNEINILIKKFKENIIIRKIYYLKNDHIYGFVHNNKIGVLISVKNNNHKLNSLIIYKQICMHIISLQPKYIEKKNIPLLLIRKYIDKEHKLIFNSNKPFKIIKKIINGKIKKKFEEICLYEQKFVFDQLLTIKKFLLINNIKINKFIFIKLGYK